MLPTTIVSPSRTYVALPVITARHWLPWELEAPARHAIHTMLILHGMGWARADWLGHSLAGRARIENGVRQPEGYDNDFELSQWLPDYDNPCLICGGPFCRAFLSRYIASRPVPIEAWRYGILLGEEGAALSDTRRIVRVAQRCWPATQASRRQCRRR
jgi:hypothetical protein